MTEETGCSRCGACCKVLLIPVKLCSKQHQHYLRTHGLKEEQGFFLIPHDCQHLKDMSVEETSDPYFECDIHDDPIRPSICRDWTGQKTIKGQRIYFPPACSFNNKT